MQPLSIDFVGQLLLAALNSGALKLNPPASTMHGARMNGENDAAYILSLVEALTTPPPTP